MSILKIYIVYFIAVLSSIGNTLEVTQSKLWGPFGQLTCDTLTKPDPEKQQDLMINARLLLTQHKIWGLDDTDWTNVVVTCFEPGGESISVLKITDPTNKKSVVIKCYNPKLKDLGLRIENVIRVANSDFTRQIRTSQDPNMPTIITASYLIRHGNQYFEIMPTAPGIELWDIFFHKYFPETPHHPTDEQYEQILKKLGLSLATFHLAGIPEERRQRLSDPSDTITFITTTILTDANFGNFVYDPDTQRFSFIDTSFIAITLEDKKDFMDDLYMMYWHTFTTARDLHEITRDAFKPMFQPIIDGYCSHPLFSEASREAFRRNMVRSLLSGPKPKFLRDMEAPSEQSQLEGQPGLWQLQE